MITIDGRTYKVPLVAVGRKIDRLHKYANRTEDGVMRKETIGVYYNFDVQCYNPDDDSYTAEVNEEYNALVDKLSEEKEEFVVTLWHGNKLFTQKAYFSDISDRLEKVGKNGTRFNNLKFKVIAIGPRNAVRA